MDLRPGRSDLSQHDRRLDVNDPREKKRTIVLAGGSVCDPTRWPSWAPAWSRVLPRRSQWHCDLFPGRCPIWPRHALNDAAHLSVDVGGSGDVCPDRAGHRQGLVSLKPSLGKREFRRVAWDSWSGMLFSNLTAYFIILSTALTLHVAGVRDIKLLQKPSRPCVLWRGTLPSCSLPWGFWVPA